MAVSMPRFSPAGYLVAAIVSMGLLDLAVPLVTWIGWPWNLAGLVPVVVGGLVIWLSMSALSRHNTSAEPFQAPTSLVTVGTFRLSRNPMYLGATLMLLGIAVALGTVTPLLVLPLYVSVMELRIVRPEEKVMLERFGEEYGRYRAGVRRWL